MKPLPWRRPVIAYTPPKSGGFTSLIDLARGFSKKFEDHKNIGRRIHETARDAGFFYLNNHGILVGWMGTQEATK